MLSDFILDPNELFEYFRTFLEIRIDGFVVFLDVGTQPCKNLFLFRRHLVCLMESDEETVRCRRDQQTRKNMRVYAGLRCSVCLDRVK